MRRISNVQHYEIEKDFDDELNKFLSQNASGAVIDSDQDDDRKDGPSEVVEDIDDSKIDKLNSKGDKLTMLNMAKYKAIREGDPFTYE